MKRTIAILLLSSFVFIAGCEDRDAQQYAKELIGVLNTYQSEVNKKIKAEKESYENLAEIYQRARDFDRLEALTQERRERSDKMAQELINADYEPHPTEFLSRLHDYGAFDFEMNRKMFELEEDAKSRYLSDIAALEVDGKNIAALSKALGEMAKPKGRFQDLKDSAAFAKAVKDELDKLPDK